MVRLLALMLSLLATALAGLAQAGTASAAELFYAVDQANRLVTFSGATPTSIARRPITGLAAGEQLVGIDVRPANGQLLGLGSTSRLYRIDPGSGAATAIGIGPFTPALNGMSFGFDFNPTVDRIRITSDTRQNLRAHPDTGGIAAVDGTLAYAGGDSGASATPRIVGSAYTNSRAGATTTQLFDIDAGRDVLALQNPPNPGTLTTIGPLGVDTGDLVGFDISATDGIAYAALQPSGQQSSGLYTIDLATGAATLVRRIGGGSAIRALAAAGTAPEDTAAPTAQARVMASTRVAALLRTGVAVRATCAEGCTVNARLLVGRRTVGNARARTIDLAGAVSLRAAFSTAGKRLVRGLRNPRVTVLVTVQDAAGNSRTLRATIRARR